MDSHRIGLSIAKRLAQSGASVVVSSRKQGNVDKAVKEIGSLPGVNAAQVGGIVCHVAKGDDRKNLVDFVSSSYFLVFMNVEIRNLI